MYKDLITSIMDSNEAPHDRMAAFRVEVAKNKAFGEVKVYNEITDLAFIKGAKGIRAEIKDFSGDQHSDFVSSIHTGHAYMQTLALREAGDPCCFLVLGTTADIATSIQFAIHRRGFRGYEAASKIKSHVGIVKDFCRQSWKAGIPIFFKGQWPWMTSDNQWADFVHYIDVMLDNSDLTTHRPKPADAEREVVSLAMRIKGIGPITAARLISSFGSYEDMILELHSHNSIAQSRARLEEIPGIGPKTSAMILGVTLFDRQTH